MADTFASHFGFDISDFIIAAAGSGTKEIAAEERARILDTLNRVLVDHPTRDAYCGWVCRLSGGQFVQSRPVSGQEMESIMCEGLAALTDEQLQKFILDGESIYELSERIDDEPTEYWSSVIQKHVNSVLAIQGIPVPSLPGSASSTPNSTLSSDSLNRRQVLQASVREFLQSESPDDVEEFDVTFEDIFEVLDSDSAEESEELALSGQGLPFAAEGVPSDMLISTTTWACWQLLLAMTKGIRSTVDDVAAMLEKSGIPEESIRRLKQLIQKRIQRDS